MPPVRLWSRQRVVVPAAVNGGGPGTIEVDTGIFKTSFFQANDVQILPHAPMRDGVWDSVDVSDPFIGSNGTVHVTFVNAVNNEATLTVFFFCPHSLIGPGLAQPVNP